MSARRLLTSLDEDLHDGGCAVDEWIVDGLNEVVAVMIWMMWWMNTPAKMAMERDDEKREKGNRKADGRGG